MVKSTLQAKHNFESLHKKKKINIVSDCYVWYKMLVGMSFDIHLFYCMPKKRSGIKTRCPMYNGIADFD
jgi:hypothetical protein